MLAKIWKKVLLAVCIVACLFNITSKLVNRHSLKDNLETANDGVTVFDIFKKDTVEAASQDEIIDPVNDEETINEKEVEVIEIDDEEEIEQEIMDEETEVEDNKETNRKNSAVKYTDYTFNF